MDLDCVIILCISHINDVMCCLLDIYDVINWLLRILEIDYFTDARKWILIFNTSLAQRYVLASSTAAVRLSSTAASSTSRPQQPNLSHPTTVCLIQQSYVSPNSRTSRSAAVCLVQQPHSVSNSRTSRPTAVERLVQQPYVSSNSRTSRSAAYSSHSSRMFRPNAARLVL